MDSYPSYAVRFNKFCLLTIISIYVLIMVGGIVRASGSGMGCPDWPKCFGRWIPPTEESELPADYKIRYAHLSYANTDFNVYKTWTEYLNRLVGVLIGFFVFLTFIFSLPFRKSASSITWLSLFSFILVAFQGWVGSKVVSSNLKPYLITIHMVIALLLTFVLIWLYAKTLPSSSIRKDRKLNILFYAGLILSFAQLVLGTRVRESVDELRKAGVAQEDVISNLSLNFYIHRSFSVLLLAVIFLIIYKLIKANGVTFAVGLLAVSAVTEVAAGMALNYLGFPAFMQPVHLLFGSVIVGVIFYLLSINNKKELPAN